MREKARVGVIEPVGAARGRADVSEAVGDGKCVAMLESAARARGWRGRQNRKFRFRRSVSFIGLDLQRGLSGHGNLEASAAGPRLTINEKQTHARRIRAMRNNA